MIHRPERTGVTSPACHRPTSQYSRDKPSGCTARLVGASHTGHDARFASSVLPTFECPEFGNSVALEESCSCTTFSPLSHIERVREGHHREVPLSIDLDAQHLAGEGE